MAKELSFIIRALDRASGVFRSVGAGAASMVSSVAGNLTSMLGVSVSLTGALMGLKTAIQQAFKLETARTQFEVLLGSAKNAQDRIEALSQFAAQTPFEFEGVTKASRILGAFSNNVLGGEKSLRMVGDAAAFANQPIEEVAMWVGRMYSAIKGGRPFGEAAQRLGEMTIMTEDVRRKLEGMQAAGASNIDVWREFETSLSGFSGGMEKLSQTGNGLASTLKDNLSLAAAEVGKALEGAAKGGIKTFSQALEKLVSDGSIKRWAEEYVDGAKMVGGALSKLSDFGPLKFLKDSFRDVAVQIGATATYGIGRANGQSAAEAEKSASVFYANYASKRDRGRAVSRLGYDPRAEEQALAAAAGGPAKGPDKWAQDSAENAALEMDMELAYLAKDQADTEKKAAEELKKAKAKEKTLLDQRKKLQEDLNAAIAKKQGEYEIDTLRNEAEERRKTAAELRGEGVARNFSDFSEMNKRLDENAADDKAFAKVERRAERLQAKRDAGGRIGKGGDKFLDRFNAFMEAKRQEAIAAALDKKANEAAIVMADDVKKSKSSLEKIETALAFLKPALQGK